jgi:AraC family transcriptional regulator
MDATIETLPEMTIAAIRHTGPYNQISEAFFLLGSAVKLSGLFELPNANLVGIYYDDPKTTPAAELRSDAGWTVPAATEVKPPLTRVTLAAGRYAMARHVGPYDQLPAKWGELYAWAGKRATPGPSFELYRNDPSNAKPAELITELYLPITA